MALSGPWWERILRGVVRRDMPGPEGGELPVPLQLGVPLNEYLEDLRIWRGAELFAYEQHVAHGAVQVVQQHAGVALARLTMQRGRLSVADQAEVLDLVRGAITGSRADLDRLLDVSLDATAQHEAFLAGEYQDLWGQYRERLPELPPWRVPPVGAISLALQADDPQFFLRGILDGMDAQVMGQAQQQVLAAALSGASVQELSGQLRRTLDMRASLAQTTARTGLHRVARNYQQNLYADAEQQGVLKRERYTATLDSATCPVCGLSDGRTYGVGKGPVVPRHPNCRCTYTPITRSAREILGLPPEDEPPDRGAVRHSMDGKVPRTLSWPDWLAKKERQTPGFARDVLGPTKWKAWVDGEIDLGDLAHAGHLRTNRQLGI